ncbi:MAG: GNAT family N-acetyltransferase [Novosphingobium sp.]
MRYEILRPSEFSPDLVSIWNDLLDQDEDLGSPFFTLEFAMAVGRCRDDLRIAVLRNSGEVTGFLPYHLKPGGCAAPVGGQICDYQGLIGVAIDPGPRGCRLLRDCGISSYDFNHGLAAQGMLEENAFSLSNSLRADLRGGYEQWRADVMAQTKQMAKANRLKRKMEREQGALRFVRHDSSEQAWDTFVAWKDEALRQEGAVGFPGAAWIDALLRDIRETDTPRFAGLFSTLYSGDRLVAAHFGMRSDRAWHWWFPSYDPAMRQYAPGLVLMLACIEEAARMGLGELDFGRGTQLFKMQFGNRARRLCEGSLERTETVSGMARALRKSAQSLANKVLPEQAATFVRRAGTKVFRAGLI